MTQIGYYQHPTVHGERIVFCCDDSLWTVSTNGGVARRLTNASAECSSPRFSPDGKWIAFVSQEEGHPEVFVMSSDGGTPKRLTYLGSQVCYVSSWSPDSKKILICSDARSPFFRHNEIFELALDGTLTNLQLGHATSFVRDEDNRSAMARNNHDPALWKRYRGGRAGEIWIDAEGKGSFKQLTKLDGNMVSPMFISGRVYFLSDHDGIGNIYSCKRDGRDLQQHTFNKEYYVRFPSTDGKRIVFTSAGNVFLLDCKSAEVKELKIEAPSQEARTARRFVDPTHYLESFSPHPDSHTIGFISRGQAFSMPFFEGPCVNYSVGSAVRNRFFEWLPDGKHFITVDDSANKERICRIKTGENPETEYLTNEDIGRVISLRVSPNGKLLAISNQRYELLLLDLEKKKLHHLDRSSAESMRGLTWSPDSKWIAYTFRTQMNLSVIKIADTSTRKSHQITREIKADFSPAWDPAGKYLYFLSDRDFRPIYDSQHFDLSFVESTRPYLITLRKDVSSPFAPDLKPFIKQEKKSDSSNNDDESNHKKTSQKKSASESDNTIQIDFDGIEERILAFPINEGTYGQLIAAKNRILFLSYTRRGLGRDHSWNSDSDGAAKLMAYDFGEQKSAVLQTGISGLTLGFDNQTLLYSTKDKVRVMDALQGINKGPDANSTQAGRSTGFIDFSRCNLLVEPRKEWAQMYREAWRLQRENFWDEAMSDVDWDLVLERYECLIPKIRTRTELSDLIWEMQGELGTSHAYEMGGDRPRPAPYHKGFLACDLSYDSKNDAYKISNILRGDSWEKEADSPLAEPGVDIANGDLILAVNGRRVSKTLSVDELLLKAGGKHIQLTTKRGNKIKNATIQPLHSERYLRYRHWVETNRKIVEKLSKGKLGYIHIPDMGPFGFSEFHRSYLSEFHHDGLVVDARYNRGGHVSSLLLEKLMRKRVGYDVSRWGTPQPYPMESPAGPMVAVTNQFAGSDGDIFSHCFKLYELGPLVGKRTWGGVIGIESRHQLVDKTLTTQPEFSFWFKDVGWSVENYGTDPDYEVDFRPQDYHAGSDPQLEKAITLALDSLRKNPFQLPEFPERPKLTLPAVQKKNASTGKRQISQSKDSGKVAASSRKSSSRKR